MSDGTPLNTCQTYTIRILIKISQYLQNNDYNVTKCSRVRFSSSLNLFFSARFLGTTDTCLCTKVCNAAMISMRFKKKYEILKEFADLLQWKQHSRLIFKHLNL